MGFFEPTVFLHPDSRREHDIIDHAAEALPAAQGCRAPSRSFTTRGHHSHQRQPEWLVQRRRRLGAG
eukprot:6157911-Pyramimonas_sp.AAC.1